MSWNIPRLRTISMQSGNGVNIATALHEVAHQIAWDYFGSSIQDHGPTWLGVMLGFALKAGMGISEIIYLFALPIFVVALALLLVIRVDSRRRSLESISQEYRQKIDKATPAQAGR